MCEINRKAYRRLTPEEVQQVLQIRSEGVPVSAIAQQFDISDRQIHRILNQRTRSEGGETVEPSGKHTKGQQCHLREQHSAWIYEELLNDPSITLESLAMGLKMYFNIDVSLSTIWRHIRCGGLEAQGFPGYTKTTEDQITL